VIARMRNFWLRRIHTTRGYFTSLVVIVALAFPFAQQSNRTTRPVPPPGPATPFHAGETLDFSGQWLGITDAFRITIKVIDGNPFYGRPAWHLQAQCHTNSYLHYLFPVDDQFDSYSTQSVFVGAQFETYIHESSKSESHIFRFASSQTPAPSGATQVQVLPGTRDPLGFVYYLRTINWNQTTEVRSPVFDGHRLYEVRASVVTPRGDVSVPAGKFSAAGIWIRLFNHGVEAQDIHLILWLAQDATRTPVLIEMQLPFGSGRIELTGNTQEN
jgi:hypothetical protein